MKYATATTNILLALVFCSFATTGCSDAFAFTTASTNTYSSRQFALGAAARLDLPPGPTNEQLADNNKDEKKKTTKFAWDKEAPKLSLEAVGKTHTANPLVLNIVEASHWSLFLPSFAASWAVMEHIDVWINYFGGDALRTTLWLLAPMIQCFAGLPPMVAHIYEDWQVSPSVEPLASEEYSPEVYTNERLRKVANLLLMSGLGVASLIQSRAYHGADLPLDILSGGLLAWAVLGDKNNLVSNYVSPFFNQSEDRSLDITVLPFPVSTLVFFVYSQILVLGTTILPLVHQVGNAAGNDNNVLPLQLAIVLPQFLAMIGGYLEGGVTEAKFDQRVHIGAVGTFFSGFALTAWSLYELGANSGQYLL